MVGYKHYPDDVVTKFLSKHSSDFYKEYKYNTTDRTHRGLRLSVEEAIEFLTDFRFKNFPDASRKAATIRYLRYLSTMEKNPLTHVYLIQMAWASKPRERNFDFENKPLGGTLRVRFPLEFLKPGFQFLMLLPEL